MSLNKKNYNLNIRDTFEVSSDLSLKHLNCLR